MAKATKRKTRRRRQEHDHYLYVIDRWDVSYTFETNPERRWGPAPYTEYCHVHVLGRFIAPKKIAGRSAEFTLMSNREVTETLSNPRAAVREPVSIGFLSSRGKNSYCLLTLPADAVWNITHLLSADRLGAIRMNGEALYRGHASIRSVTLCQSLDADDFLD